MLIARLDLSFGAGLTVLTGETGAGKSILLDGLGLALGGRAEAGLVREGAEQAVASATFLPPAGHAVAGVLAEHGLDTDEMLVLRRIVGRDGRSRALINDQPVGVGLLRRVGAMLVEVQGQHDQQGLADAAGHRAVLDQFGVPASLREAVAARFGALQEGRRAHREALAAMEATARDREWIEHQVAELEALAPAAGEEDELAAERQALQGNERRAEALGACLAELTPRERRTASPASAVRAAARALERMGRGAEDATAPALAALERAEEALAEAEQALQGLLREAAPDPRRLEKLEERLFALRAAGRKHAVPVAGLAALREAMRGRLSAIENGEQVLVGLARAEAEARTAYGAAAAELGTLRREAAARLADAMNRELRPLRLERARFVVELVALAEAEWGAAGAEAVRFLIATNPGSVPGPLGRIASGGELSRLMLALKVVIASTAPLPTLVFDEVDSGIGGATAASVGERLAVLARDVQVLVVTHSPQVAARGTAHARVEKLAGKSQARTQVAMLDGPARREEIARMLAGESVTDAARSAADSLLAGI